MSAPRRPGKPPEPDTDEGWRAFVRTTKPLRKARETSGSTPPSETPPPSPVKTQARREPQVIAPPTPTPPLRFTERRERQLRRGDLEPEAVLDLHGLRQEEAHDALLRFIARHQARGSRLLGIVTGKGSAGRPSILRASLPRWLEEPPLRESVLALRPAAPAHGGAGAVYVVLRRTRTKSG